MTVEEALERWRNTDRCPYYPGCKPQKCTKCWEYDPEFVQLVVALADAKPEAKFDSIEELRKYLNTE